MTRLLFAAVLLGLGGWAAWWVSPLNQGVAELTVTAISPYQYVGGGRSDGEDVYQLNFKGDDIHCGFRLEVWWSSLKEVRSLLELGDSVEVIYDRSSLADAAADRSMDCLTGEPTPEKSIYSVPSPLFLPNLISATEVWKDGRPLGQWVPRRVWYGFAATVFLLLGLIILLAPLIDRLWPGPNRRARQGMAVLSKFDEEAFRRRNRK